MEKSEDPWNWTVNDVVDEFCKTRGLWAVDRPHATLPDPVNFERLLRKNEVDGSTLLLQINAEELKTDLEIKTLGQRSAVLWAIQQLRFRSPKWQENNRQDAMLRPQHLLLSGAQTPNSVANHAPFPVVPWGGYSPSLPTIRDTPVPADHIKARTSRLSIDQADVCLPDTNGDVTVLSNGTSAHGKTPSIRHTSPAQTQHPSPEPLAGHRRQGEQLVEDGFGRKKRRLVLGAPAARPSAPAEDANHHRNWLLLPSRSTLSKTKSPGPAYYGPRKFTPDSIFFGKTKFGQPMNSEWDVRPAKGKDEPAIDFELVLHRDRNIPGQQRK